MNRSIPGREEIKLAIFEVFNLALQIDPKQVAYALRPRWKVNQSVQAAEFYSPNEDSEMRELCELVNDCQAFIGNANDLKKSTRLKIIAYCHIMEAGLPLVVIWNLIRIIDRQTVEWLMTPTYSKSKSKTLIYPNERIDEILAGAVKQELSIGFKLRNLWSPELRNAFSHSQYTIFNNGHVSGSENTSPTTSPAFSKKRIVPGQYYFTDKEISAYHEGARAYLLAFSSAYWKVRNLRW
jgi:hypothetical protein